MIKTKGEFDSKNIGRRFVYGKTSDSKYPFVVSVHCGEEYLNIAWLTEEENADEMAKQLNNVLKKFCKNGGALFYQV